MCSMRVYPVSCQLSCSAVNRGWGIQIYLEMNYYFNFPIAIILIICFGMHYRNYCHYMNIA